jgi:hypothetical protein
MVKHSVGYIRRRDKDSNLLDQGKLAALDSRPLDHRESRNVLRRTHTQMTEFCKENN